MKKFEMHKTHANNMLFQLR